MLLAEFMSDKPHHSGSSMSVCPWVCMRGVVRLSLAVLCCQQHSYEQTGCGVIDTLQKVVHQLSAVVR